MKNSIVEEFKRSPVTVSATVVGLIIAALSLLLAWLQFLGTQSPPLQDTVSAPHASIHLSIPNCLLVLSFFFAAAFSGASLIRIIARSHPFQAWILSVIVAVLASFFSLVVFTLAPPREVTGTVIAAANDAAFYGMVVIFVTINGFPILRPLTNAVLSSKNTENGETIDTTKAFILIMLFLLLTWGLLVAKGQSMMVQTFLVDNLETGKQSVAGYTPQSVGSPEP